MRSGEFSALPVRLLESQGPIRPTSSVIRSLAALACVEQWRLGVKRALGLFGVFAHGLEPTQKGDGPLVLFTPRLISHTVSESGVYVAG